MTTNLRDSLNSLKSTDPAPVVSDAPAKPQFQKSRGHARPIKNKYGNRCINCKRWVDAEQGLCIRDTVSNKWQVFHVDAAACQASGRTTADIPAAAGTVKLDFATVPQTGIYTVEGDEGHTTFSLHYQKEDQDFFPGKVLVRVLRGTDNTSDYESVGYCDPQRNRVILWKKYKDADVAWKHDLATLLADPSSVLEAKTCRRCNRLLTEPVSLANGIGPECAKMV